MIIYNTQLVEKELTMKAIEGREKLKPLLKGIVCHLCSKDTQISWNKENGMSPIINACCSAFEKKILDRLGIKK